MLLILYKELYMARTEETWTNMAAEHPMADRLGYVLKRAQHALRTTMDDRLSHLGLTTAQFNVLSAVQQQPCISNAALARGSFVTAQSMLGTVANLEKTELLRRTPHEIHGRIMQSALTQKVRRCWQALMKRFTRWRRA